MGWRRFYKMPFSDFEINNEYRSLPLDEYVYNRKGELLFFYSYHPSEIEHRVEGLEPSMNWVSVYSEDSRHYGCRGLDCEGIPVFSNYTYERTADCSFEWICQYEPLTVKTVVMWLDWLMINKVENINV